MDQERFKVLVGRAKEMGLAGKEIQEYIDKVEERESQLKIKSMELAAKKEKEERFSS
jgi:DNA-binding transcriptional MerR regulator